eukprot:1176593-Prorocentrum_minimum.AAC.2
MAVPAPPVRGGLVRRHQRRLVRPRARTQQDLRLSWRLRCRLRCRLSWRPRRRCGHLELPPPPPPLGVVRQPVPPEGGATVQRGHLRRLAVPIHLSGRRRRQARRGRGLAGGGLYLGPVLRRRLKRHRPLLMRVYLTRRRPRKARNLGLSET